MADLIDRAALLEKLELLAKHEDPFRETVIRGVMFTISNETAVDAVEVEALRRQLLKAGTLLYGGDEIFEKRMGGYNPSSFVAGFNYALERMMAWAKSLEAERRTDAPNRC